MTLLQSYSADGLFFYNILIMMTTKTYMFLAYGGQLVLFLQSDESIYERECGNMPGFAVYYRYPNSQRVTYGQFIKVIFH